MRIVLGKLMVVGVCVLSACGADQLPTKGTENGRTVLTAACSGDDTCPAGMVCEGCNGANDAVCIPGCRTDAQCPARFVCRGPVTCLSCPCAPGWCELDPCRDVDGDGYAFTDDPSISCPGKQKGDCNEANKDQHPGAKELCANGADDDCDGRVDRQDPSCQMCTSDSLVCNDSSECGQTQPGQVKCEAGCCQSCPSISYPSCGTGKVAVGGGLDATTGCRVARVCVDSAQCQNSGYDAVCGVDYATYRNPCQAAQVGVAVLHRGGCRWDEGEACSTSQTGTQGTCGVNLYCRSDAEAGKRCTQLFTCRVDADCPAGATTPSCGEDAGVARWSCVSNQCVARCQ